MKKKLNYRKILKKILFSKETFYFVFFAFLFFTIRILFLKIGKFERNNNFFKIKQIELNLDNKVLYGKNAMKYLSIEKSENLMAIKLKNFHDRILKSHPEILKVNIYKIPPSKLKIILEKRKPFAQVRLGQFYPVDGSCFILPFPHNFQIENLPLIIGIFPREVNIAKQNSSQKLEKAIKLLKMVKNKFNINLNKVNIDVSNEKNILIYFNETEVRIGAKNFEERLDKLIHILKDIESKGIKPKYIDLRFEKAILGPR
jgi:cell division septal protein FtsQ